ncbi:MAG: 4a-hydroxytetrahydrobiopterin dehydratase [Kangiellaceae bacterium]|nr:4a-hydroxytetrahydrobiopterin dehydratase [Kangiellaceae bacterium]
MIERLTTKQVETNLQYLNNKSECAWRIKQGKLTKQFTFFNFVDAFEFMKKVAVHAEKTNHHPEWSNIYNKVVVELTTHDVESLTILDFDLALNMEKQWLEVQTS